MSADLCFTGGKMGDWSRGDFIAFATLIVAIVAGIGTWLAIPQIRDFVFGKDESRTAKFSRLVAAFLV